MQDYYQFKNIGGRDFPYFMMDEQMNLPLPNQLRQHIMHWHHDFQITLVTAGHITFKTLHAQEYLGAGQILFINTGVVHQIIPEEDAAYLTYRFSKQLVSFSGLGNAAQLIEDLAQSERLPYLILNKNTSWQIQMTDLLNRLTHLEKKRTELYEYEVLTLLAQITCLILKQGQTGQPMPLSKQEERIRQVLAYIEREFDQKISLEDLAQSAHISTTECMRTFKEVLGTSPYRYLMDYRLDRTLPLLARTDLTITDIAIQSGFSTTSYFIRCFQKSYGQTPGQYRKSLQKSGEKQSSSFEK